MGVSGIDPENFFGPFRGRNVQVDRDGLAVAAAQYAFQHFGRTGVDFLVRDVWRYINEVAWASLGGEFELVAPAHSGAPLDHVDHAFEVTMVVRSGPGIGVNGDGSSPEFLGPDSGKVDRGFAVHARRRGRIAVELIAWDHFDAVVLPSGLGRFLPGRMRRMTVRHD